MNVTPNDLIRIHPVDFAIEDVKANLYYEGVTQDTAFEGSFSIRITDGAKKFMIPFNTLSKNISDINESPVDMHCEISFMDSASIEAEIFRKYYAELPAVFKVQLKTWLIDALEPVVFPPFVGAHTISNLDEAIRQL